jgi:hypothetical protein
MTPWAEDEEKRSNRDALTPPRLFPRPKGVQGVSDKDAGAKYNSFEHGDPNGLPQQATLPAAQSKADLPAPLIQIRLTPNSGHRTTAAACPRSVPRGDIGPFHLGKTVRCPLFPQHRQLRPLLFPASELNSLLARIRRVVWLEAAHGFDRSLPTGVTCPADTRSHERPD